VFQQFSRTTRRGLGKIIVIALFVALLFAAAIDDGRAFVNPWKWYTGPQTSAEYVLYSGFVRATFDAFPAQWGTIDRIVADADGTDLYVILLDNGNEAVTTPEYLQQPYGLEPGSAVIYNPTLPLYECTREEFRVDATMCWASMFAVLGAHVDELLV
jgi:hypothetical protein